MKPTTDIATTLENPTACGLGSQREVELLLPLGCLAGELGSPHDEDHDLIEMTA